MIFQHKEQHNCPETLSSTLAFCLQQGRQTHFSSRATHSPGSSQVDRIGKLTSRGNSKFVSLFQYMYIIKLFTFNEPSFYKTLYYGQTEFEREISAIFIFFQSIFNVSVYNLLTVALQRDKTWSQRYLELKNIAFNFDKNIKI